VRPQVGAVGARLLYPDGRVQHAGVALGIGGDPPVAGHMGHKAARSDVGYYGQYVLARDVSAVTAACMCLRREVFEAAGGFDETALKVAFNDVDLCLKIRALGLRVIWTPHAELIHHESASRGDDMDEVSAARFRAEVEVMRGRWGPVLDSDPLYGVNFDRRHGDFRLAPKAPRPPTWRYAAAAAERQSAVRETCALARYGVREEGRT
ncbi:MAG TPA: hypothetical protein VIO94_13265, partial [Phenylobacterium sp.]